MMAAMHRVAVMAATVALAIGVMNPATPWALAHDMNQDGPDWQDTSLTSSTSRLFTPSSGALLAVTSDGLMRSDDAGDNWYQVDTAQHQVVYVDPTNQDSLYATSPMDPLLVSPDGGASWKSLMSGPPYAGKQLNAVAVSPAAANVIYAGLKQGSISDEYWFYRSNDAGMTWTELFHAHNSLCGWGVAILQPHPTDASRLFFSGGCHAGRYVSETLKHSTDQGQTFIYSWSNPGASTVAAAGFPKSLAGGRGANPQRWYLSVNRDARAGGSFLVASDDDAVSWDTVLDYAGGGTESPDRDTSFSTTMQAVAYDPSNPDTAYVARSGANAGYPPTPVTSGVTVTSDRGQTWNDLGNQQEGTLNDLALGIDGQYLFLATDHGVSRMPLQ